MRLMALLLLGLCAGAQGFAAKRASVDDLRQVVAGARGEPDGKLAKRIAGLELTERLSQANLDQVEAGLPGPASRASLVAIADVSEFLDLPEGEIPFKGVPDLAAQREMMARTVEYARKNLSQLPNFSATRGTTRYEGSELKGPLSLAALQPAGGASETVLFRDGKEVVDSKPDKDRPAWLAKKGLKTFGEFGGVFTTVLVDAAHGELSWGYWQKGADADVAVFRYKVPKDKSHHKVRFCCVDGPKGELSYDDAPAYHGEIAIDALNGTVLRLTMRSDFMPADPLIRADTVVEYGPVEIGGTQYVCPLRSISVSVAPMQHMQIERPPLRTSLNNVLFEKYHLFRSESRMITDDQ